MPEPFKAITKIAIHVSASFLFVFFNACSDKTRDNITIIKALDESLITSNKIIGRETQLVLSALQEKLNDPKKKKKAEFWYSRAMDVQKLSDDIIFYIENLKDRLKEESPGEGDIKAVNRLFSKENKGKELFERLNKYKEDIMRVDSQLTHEFNNSIAVTTESFETIENKEKDFTQTFFRHTPSTAANAMLNKFQNNIMVNENRMLQFCNLKVSSFFEDLYRTYSAIITQSSTYVRPGEEIEITAGVGSFSKAALPEIKVKGKIIPLTDRGFVLYSFKSPNKPGKYNVPVKIKYIDGEGMEQTIEKNVEYTVAEETGINN